MLINFRVILVLAATVMSIAACSNNATTVSGNKWTFLVYMDADNNLDAFSTQNLRQMQEVGSTENVTVIVQYDTRAGSTRRYKVERGGLTLLADLGELDMAKPDTLRDFISYAAGAYPAEHYALILWDHGSGWKKLAVPKTVSSILEDWSSNGQSAPALSNRLVAQAIKSAEDTAGIKLDILGIDACIMATVEAAYEFRNSADILVSSQELVQSGGWDYRTLLARLVANPLMTPSELASAMVTSYQQFAESPAYGWGDQTISAVKLGHDMEKVAQAVDSLALALKSAMDDPITRPATLAAISSARAAVQEFDQVTNPATYVDLSDFSRLLSGNNNPVQAALGNVVLAEYHGKERPGAHGLSVVFFDLPRALSFSTQVYDSDYTNYDPATGRGSQIAFITAFNWDEMMHDYLSLNYPNLPQ